MAHQPGIFIEGSRNHWFFEFTIDDVAPVGAAIATIRAAAAAGPPLEHVEATFAFGDQTARKIFGDVVPDSMRDFAGVADDRAPMPATGGDLFVWLHSDRHDRNWEVAHQTLVSLRDCATLLQEVPAWHYRDARDLTGFIDGTENPSAEDGQALALEPDGAAVLFCQRWVHNLDAFAALSNTDQQQVIGRTKPDSVELDPLPPDSHVGRVVLHDELGNEREIYRRSVPYGTASEAGLYFLAFPGDLSLIEDILSSMVGTTTVHDRLTDFTTAKSGAFYYAPSAEALSTFAETD